mmetsp:Transcript_72968/g.128561  ORF Transcript_72968/g.128561 Transcript_72968/m.128561 type:complete len:200 (-) Transcript_72968:186-785(-)
MPTSNEERLRLLMIPNVTVELRPRGLPMAMAQAPTSSRLESPSSAWGRSLAPSILRTAKSRISSEPTTLQVNCRPSVNVAVTLSALATTCALVMRVPWRLMMRPEPKPRIFSCWSSGLWILTSGPKKNRNRPSSPPTSNFTVRMVSILTTAGPTLSTASVTKFRPRALARLMGSTVVLIAGRGPDKKGNVGAAISALHN